MAPSTRQLPEGTVTFVFTDIEGSTRLLAEVGDRGYGELLVAHRELIRSIVEGHGGVELGTEGDAFFLVFADAPAAVEAAVAMQDELAGGELRIRVGIHTGEPLVIDDDYVGIDIHKAARICSAAHGGQVLLSAETRARVERDGNGRVVIRDLGFHRLKDLTGAQRLFQLGEREFPAPRALRRGNLPAQPTPLLGRGRELAELVQLAGRYQLLTLTGPGGGGKTRLALALAAELSDQAEDGPWWVPLAAVSGSDLVLPAIAEVLGARGSVAEHIGDCSTLIILDNLEHVLDAAAEVGELLLACPRLRVIATSRERLALAAEGEYPVPALSEAAATELFVTRARQVQPEFVPDGLVSEVCSRLDRLPLALELASTRVKLMDTGQMLARLERRLPLLTAGRRDLPARQATMRAAIDWSYELLLEEEQRVFRALSVFAGSFELAAAEFVCGADLDVLQSLVDKSLLRVGESGRFFLLETTHEYAHERASELDELSNLSRRHAEWFFDLADRADRELRTAAQSEWLARLRADNENFRIVLAWALKEDVPRGLGLANVLSTVWGMSGRHAELCRWYERALAQSGIPAARRAESLRSYSFALLDSNKPTEAEAAGRESVSIYRSLADRLGEAAALNSLSSVRWAQGAADDAVALRTETLSIFRSVGDQAGAARSLHLLGESLRDAGEFDRGRELLTEAVATEMELGNRRGAMTSVHSLGDLELDARDPARAAAHFEQALAICRDLGDERSEAYCLAGLACAARLEGDEPAAQRLWAETVAIEERMGQQLLANERARYESILGLAAGESGG